MTLIEMVKHCYILGCSYIAQDSNGEWYAYKSKPSIKYSRWVTYSEGYKHIATTPLPKDFTKRFIDITKLKGVNYE